MASKQQQAKERQANARGNMTIDTDLTKEQEAMFHPGCFVVLHPESKHQDAGRVGKIVSRKGSEMLVEFFADLGRDKPRRSGRGWIARTAQPSYNGVAADNQGSLRQGMPEVTPAEIRAAVAHSAQEPTEAIQGWRNAAPERSRNPPSLGGGGCQELIGKSEFSTIQLGHWGPVPAFLVEEYEPRAKKRGWRVSERGMKMFRDLGWGYTAATEGKA